MTDRRAILGLGAGAALALPAMARAQNVATPVLVVDSEALFSRSAYGLRVKDELAAQRDALASENRQLEDDLRAEEMSLTEKRDGMDPQAFREAADAFDARVQDMRRTQDAKEAALRSALSDAQADFMGQIQPILGALMAERGAGVILDQRAVFVWTTALDVTDAAVARLDAELGDGTGGADSGAP